jgi:SAM-dependent methyltransferase
MPEIVNHDMAAAWDGAQGDEWVEREDQMNEALSAHTDHLFAAAAVGPDEHVLDIGCGTGETTRACALRAVGGRVLGVDLSTAMLERGRMRAADAGLINVDFEHGDAQVYPFASDHFDLVVSRFGVMFFDDPVAAFVNIGRATKPGGRLALVVWQELLRNEWVTVVREALAVGRDLPVPAAGTPGPFGLGDRELARGILERAGFGQVSFDDVSAPFSFGAGADEAFDFAQGIGIVKGLLDDLDDERRAQALDSLRTVMDARDAGGGVAFDSRVWVINAVR